MRPSWACAAALVVAFAGCATHRPVVPLLVPSGTTVEGTASWYGPGYDGRATSSGERFDQDALTAAHYNWAFGTWVRVTLLSSGRSVVVKINDRFPRRDRVIDLSRGAARSIGLIGSGTGRVRLEVVPGPGEASEARAPAPSPPPVTWREVPRPEQHALRTEVTGSLIRAALPTLGEVECQPTEEASLTCRTPGSLVTVRFAASSHIRLASLTASGLPEPLILAMATEEGRRGSETAILGESQGTLRELMHVRTGSDDALCVGDLGAGKPPGAALFRVAEAEAGGHRFEVTRYAWTGWELRQVETLRSLRRYPTWRTASWELGLSCKDVLGRAE